MWNNSSLGSRAKLVGASSPAAAVLRGARRSCYVVLRRAAQDNCGRTGARNNARNEMARRSTLCWIGSRVARRAVSINNHKSTWTIIKNTSTLSRRRKGRHLGGITWSSRALAGGAITADFGDEGTLEDEAVERHSDFGKNLRYSQNSTLTTFQSHVIRPRGIFTSTT